jgi:phosphate transport system protein
MASQPVSRPMIDVSKMAEAMESMARDSLGAFARRDDRLAQEILQRDDEVDRQRDVVFYEVMADIGAHPELLQRGVDLILVSRNFERIADHATNIAESVIFVVLGKDVRRYAGSREV